MEQHKEETYAGLPAKDPIGRLEATTPGRQQLYWDTKLGNNKMSTDSHLDKTIEKCQNRGGLEKCFIFTIGTTCKYLGERIDEGYKLTEKGPTDLSYHQCNLYKKK